MHAHPDGVALADNRRSFAPAPASMHPMISKSVNAYVAVGRGALRHHAAVRNVIVLTITPALQRQHSCIPVAARIKRSDCYPFGGGGDRF
ncbi:hypothetical protein ABIA96_002529 [Bradyrhizobium sp. LB11.1]|jgi:hypothetical protein